jgi:hypothetical protein
LGREVGVSLKAIIARLLSQKVIATSRIIRGARSMGSSPDLGFTRRFEIQRRKLPWQFPCGFFELWV